MFNPQHLRTAFRDHYIPFYSKPALRRLLKDIKAEVKSHYKPASEYESWLVVIDV